MAEPTHPHPNQHLYPNDDLYPCTTNGYSPASDRYGHGDGNGHAYLHALANLHPLPYPHRYPDAHAHPRAAYADIYASSANIHAYSDPAAHADLHRNASSAPATAGTYGYVNPDPNPKALKRGTEYNDQGVQRGKRFFNAHSK